MGKKDTEPEFVVVEECLDLGGLRLLSFHNCVESYLLAPLEAWLSFAES